MVAPKKKSAQYPSAPPPADAREALLSAGISLFARHGLDGTTVRDLAAMAGTNICMISYHFEGKEGLYRACLDAFGRSRLEMARDVLQPATGREDFGAKLRLLLSLILKSNAEFPDLTRMLEREMEAGFPVAKEIYEATFLQIFTSLVQFFRAAQKSGLVRPELDPLYLCVTAFGSLKQSFRSEVVTSRYFNRSIRTPKEQERLVETILGLFLDGCLVPSANEERRGH